MDEKTLRLNRPLGFNDTEQRSFCVIQKDIYSQPANMFLLLLGIQEQINMDESFMCETFEDLKVSMSQLKKPKVCTRKLET